MTLALYAENLSSRRGSAVGLLGSSGRLPSYILLDLVETDLLGNTLSSGSVLGTGSVVEDRIDLFEGKTLELDDVSASGTCGDGSKLTSGRMKTA
jgi:hypothetical protein